jgi:MoaA/NifB/PqqE/SkfB family radical SAM enzyme
MIKSTTGRLALESKLRQLRFASVVSEISRKGLPKGPIAVDLDPTTVCDLACPECISAEGLNRGRFSDQRLMQIVAELIAMEIKAVVFIGGGEPLLHPMTAHAIERFADAGIQVGLTTNGTMLHRFLRSVEQHISWTRVSLDAASEEVFRRFRPARSTREPFKAILNNLRLANDVKRGSVGVSFVATCRGLGAGDDTNIYEIASAAHLAKAMGCDYFEVKAEMAADHSIKDLPPDLLVAVGDQIAKAEALQTDCFEVAVSSSLRALLRGIHLTQLNPFGSCLVSNLRMTISPNGAFACAYHRGNTLAKLGDPSTESIEEIWKRIPELDLIPARDCRFHCARHGQNVLLHSLRAGGSYMPQLDRPDDVFV